MSELELASIANDAAEHLAGLSQPIHVRRAMAGSFMVSLTADDAVMLADRARADLSQPSRLLAHTLALASVGRDLLL